MNKLIRAANLTPFDEYASVPDNLRGRTNYANPDTMRFFRARFHDSHVAHESVLVVLESIKNDGDSRVYRVKVFNIFGTVIADTCDSSSTLPEGAPDAFLGFSTLAKARKVFVAACKLYTEDECMSVTRSAISARVARLERDIADMRAALEG